jgi:hypothetical protein
MSALPPKADIGLNIFADPGCYFCAAVERLITGRGDNDAIRVEQQVRFWEHVFDLAADALDSQAVCRGFDSLRPLQFLEQSRGFLAHGGLTLSALSLLR